MVASRIFSDWNPDLSFPVAQVAELGLSKSTCLLSYMSVETYISVVFRLKTIIGMTT